MKKFLSIVILLIGVALFAQAQQPLFPRVDTLSNTDTAYLTAPRLSSQFDVITAQLNVTKISGTVAGSAVVQASLDGVNYATVPGSDTLTLTNGNSSQIWPLGTSNYIYYRVRVITSGTQSSQVKGYILYRK